MADEKTLIEGFGSDEKISNPVDLARWGRIPGHEISVTFATADY
jgi:hypothetical protein